MTQIDDIFPLKKRVLVLESRGRERGLGRAFVSPFQV